VSAVLLKIAKQIGVTLLTDSEKRKKLLAILGVVCSLLILVPAMAISLPGILFKSLTSHEINVDDLNDGGLENNKNYVKVRNYYLDYLDSLEIDIDSKVEKLKRDREYTVEIEEVQEDGTIKTRTETRQPQVIKDVRIEKPELRHILAFLSAKYMENQEVILEENRTEENSKYPFKKKEIKSYLKTITTYTETTQGSDPITLIVRYELLNIEEIARTIFTFNDYGEGYLDKQEVFIASFESMSDYVDVVANEIYDFIDLSTLNVSPNGMEIPLMLQYDGTWGNHSYGTSTIKSSGCAILSMAMVEAYLKGKVPSPVYIANWASSHNFYYSGVGTSWGFFEGYTSSIGITSRNLAKNTSLVIKALEQGKPVIASMKPGTFTNGGHFIVLRGITKSGKILVNDPNDNFYSKKFFEREFDYSLIYAESKNFWSFE